MKILAYRALGAVVALPLILATTSALADEFPDGVRTPAAAEVTTLMAGKTWIMSPRRGGNLQLEHAADGGMLAFVGGKSDTGTWRSEDGKVCYEFRVFTSACNDVRLLGEDVYFRRSSGEVVKMRLP